MSICLIYIHCNRLYQDELIALPPEILTAIVRCTHINDMRTIFLAHDKRMLGVLTDPDIMKDYVSQEDIEILQRHIVKTYVCGEHESARQEAKDNRAEWLIKPNGGGKGIGLVFGRDCTAEEWHHIVDDPRHSTYVLQPVVKQHVHEIVTKGAAVQEMLLVGLLLCFNDKFLGPGIFRASSLDHPIVNVAGGNEIILSPVVLSSRWPLARKVVGTKATAHGNSERTSQREAAAAEETATVEYKHLEICEHTNLLFAFPPHCAFDIRSRGTAVAVSESRAEVMNEQERDKDSYASHQPHSLLAPLVLTLPEAVDGGRTISTLSDEDVAGSSGADLELHQEILDALVTDGIALVHADWPLEEINDRMIDFVSRLGMSQSLCTSHPA